MVTAGSVSKLSDILSQIRSTRRSKVCFTLMLSLALVSKNSNPLARGRTSSMKTRGERKRSQDEYILCHFLAKALTVIAATEQVLQRKLLLRSRISAKKDSNSATQSEIHKVVNVPYPTVLPAVCHYPLRPLSPLPYHTFTYYFLSHLYKLLSPFIFLVIMYASRSIFSSSLYIQFLAFPLL